MKITNAGLRAIAAARTNGPLVDIVKFAVGSSYNYTPDPTDTSLRGTQLYPIGSNPAPPSNYFLTTNSDGTTVANYSLVMDDSIGDFSFGEIGIYLPDGTLFALKAQSYLQPKIQSTPSTAGNTIEILIRLALGTDTPIIEFSTITASTATLADLGSLDLAEVPAAQSSNIVRIVELDQYGRAPTLQKATSDRWYSPQYDMLVASGLVSTANGSHYSVESLGLDLVDYNVVPGRYLIRFTSGALEGRVRNVIAIPAWVASKVYVANELARPVANNGRFYRVTVAGTAGASEPVWPTTIGATVTSGSVTFIDMGPANTKTLSWAGSLGTPVPTGTTFDLYRASSFSDLPRYINEFRMNSRAQTHFSWHH